jgi:hypothetical protein
VQRKRQAWQKSLHTLTAALQARTADPNNPVRIHLGMTGSDVQTLVICHPHLTAPPADCTAADG